MMSEVLFHVGICTIIGGNILAHRPPAAPPLTDITPIIIVSEYCHSPHRTTNGNHGLLSLRCGNGGLLHLWLPMANIGHKPAQTTAGTGDFIHASASDCETNDNGG